MIGAAVPAPPGITSTPSSPRDTVSARYSTQYSSVNLSGKKLGIYPSRPLPVRKWCEHQGQRSTWESRSSNRTEKRRKGIFLMLKPADASQKPIGIATAFFLDGRGMGRLDGRACQSCRQERRTWLQYLDRWPKGPWGRRMMGWIADDAKRRGLQFYPALNFSSNGRKNSGYHTIRGLHHAVDRVEKTTVAEQ